MQLDINHKYIRDSFVFVQRMRTRLHATNTQWTMRDAHSHG